MPSPSRRAAVPPDSEVLEQLRRILADPLFGASRRLSRFLEFVVTESLCGRGKNLKEHSIGMDVFDRGPAYSPQEDPIVRIMAGRLRAKLAEYYAQSGQPDPVIIGIPRGAYVPQFRYAAVAGQAHLAAAAEPRRAPRSVAVGREHEIERLNAAYGSARAGHGSAVFISGEAGLGKTTVAERFLDALPGAGERVLMARGRCSERLAESDAFVPIYESLESLLHGAQADRVADILKAAAPSWHAHVARVDPAERRAAAGVSFERMRREFVSFFADLSRLHPVVVFLDDLHWADASTCDLIAYLAGRLRDLRVLLIMAYRTAEGSHPRSPFLSLKLTLDRAGLADELPLPLLTRDHAARYVAVRFPANEFPPGFADLVHQRSEGNPLFMADLLRLLEDRGILLEKNGTWRLERPAAELNTLIPSGASNMIRAKLAQVTEEDRALLRCAATQGMEFDSAVMAQVLGRDPAAVEERLQELDAIHDYVRAVEEREFPSRALSVRYRFVHVFYQNALHASLAPTRRAQYSLEIARTLVSFLGPASAGVAAELALLFEAGRDPANAAAYFLQAARNAARVFAYTEAAILCRRGLRAVLALPPSAERDAGELTLSMMLGMSQMATGGYAAVDAEQTHRRSRELCLALGEKRRLLSVLWALHTCQVNSGDLVPSLDVAREMRTFAEEMAEPGGIVQSLHATGTSLAFMGRLTAARAALEQVLLRFPVEDHVFRPALYVLDPYVTSLSMLARLLSILGRLEEARGRAAESVALARRLEHTPSLAYATLWVGWIAHGSGDYAQSCAPLEQVMAWARDHSLQQLFEWARVVRGSALCGCGRAEEGVAEIRSSIAEQWEMRSLIERPYCLTLLAEALLPRAEFHAEAFALCEKALRLAEDTGGICYQSQTYRVLGELRLAGSAGAFAEAERDFLQSFTLAREADSGLYELRTALSYASACSAAGFAERGREPLRQALTRVTGDCALLRQARDTLDRAC